MHFHFALVGLFSLMCINCPKRFICKKICSKVELILRGPYGHSILSIYKVTFVDPSILEEVAWANNPQVLRDKSNQKKLKTRILLLSKFLKSCTIRQRQCITSYYGLKDNTPLVEQKIANNLGVSQNTVSFHLRAAKRKLKKLFLLYNYNI